MSEGSEQDKSELPTPFKLMQAREKGSVARGTDLGFMTALCAFTGCAWVAGAGFAGDIGRAATRLIAVTPGVASGSFPIEAVASLGFSVAVPAVAVLAAALFTAVLLFELVQTGFVFSAQPLKPDFTRLNPAKGLKRLFTVKLLLEAAKNIAKMAAYIFVAWLALRSLANAEVGGIADAGSLLRTMSKAAIKLLACFVGVALVFAAIDQLIARRDYLKKMRMSRREVRREFRDREGEPRIKQRRKQLHADFAKASEGLRNVRDADVLVTNPTHLAIALKYDGATMSAPMVVASGADELALRLRRIAFIYGVAVIEDRALARSLFKACRIGQPVPEACFRPVADLYVAMRRKRAEAEAVS